MFSARWLYSIYMYIQINTVTKANTLHLMPHAFTCQAAVWLPRPPAAAPSAPPSLLSSWQWIFCCFVAFFAFTGSLLSLQHFNIAATRQNVNVNVYFLLLLCTFSCIFITRRQLVAWVQVQCCAVQCAATFTAHFGLCLSAAAAALGKRCSLTLCLSLCFFKHTAKAVWQVALHEPKKTPNANPNPFPTI